MKPERALKLKRVKNKAIRGFKVQTDVKMKLKW